MGQFGKLIGYVVGRTVGKPVFVPSQEHLGEVYLSYISSWMVTKARIQQKKQAVVQLDCIAAERVSEDGLRVVGG
jgi:hypothetical protein